MIVVTGGTGQLGHAIIEDLLNRVSPDQVGASVRDPDKAADLAARGVRIRRGDFEDPDGLRHAFEGATTVLIVSSNARARGGDTLAQHRNAIEAAKDVGAERIVYTSHMGASATSAFPPMHDHAVTEGMLRQSGLPWTALRNGFYAASGLALMGDALTSGVVVAPADGKVSWTTHADLAEAAAIVLADGPRWEGPTPPLVAPEAHDLADLAELAANLLRRPVRREVLADEEQRTRLVARGVPPGAVEAMLGFSIGSRRGEFVSDDPTLGQLLGRPLARMHDLIATKVVA